MKTLKIALLAGLILPSAAMAKSTAIDYQKMKEEIKQEVVSELGQSKKNENIGELLDGKVKLTGQVRVRPEVRRNLAAAVPSVPGQITEDFSVLLRSRFGLEFSPEEHVSFFIQGQDSREFGEEVASGVGLAADDEGMDLHQGYVDIKNLGGNPWLIRMGRQEVKLGEERLLGAVNWSNTGRSLDGVVIAYNPEDWGLTALGAITNRSVGGDGQYLTGVYGSWKKFPHGVLDAYYLLLQDNDGAAGAAAGTGDTLSVHTLGSRIKAQYDNGIDYGVEGAVQLGKFGSNSILAYAAHGALGYTFEPDWKPRIGLEYNYATGDNGATNKYSKFNNLLPTNHDKYGLMDMATWSNMHDGSVGFGAKPGKFVVDTKYHLLLVDKNNVAGDTFAGFAGAPGLGKIAGHELDLSAKYTFNKYLELGAGVSHLIPGSFFKDQGMTSSSNFGYFQVIGSFQ